MRGTGRIAFAVLVFSTLSFRSSAQVESGVAREMAAGRDRATAGDVVAQFSIGSFLYYGTANTAEAVTWFRKAAAQGFADAEFQMGQLHDFGFGVAQDDRLALEWYRKAAGRGHPQAERALGEFYAKGRNVNADLAEAARWYRRAADGDDLRAQYQVGMIHFEGTGVTRDYQAAYVWFTLAAGQTPLTDNRKQIIELRNIAAARMTPTLVAAADRQVAAWKPRPFTK